MRVYLDGYRLSGSGLGLRHGTEYITIFHELVITAAGNNPAVFQYVYHIAVFHGIESMGDDKKRFCSSQFANRLLDDGLGRTIERVGRFIKYEQFGFVIKGPCNCNTLALATAEANAPFTDNRIETIRQFSCNELVNMCHSSGCDQGLVIDVLRIYPEGDVAGDGVVGQENLLWHIACVDLPRGGLSAP